MDYFVANSNFVKKRIFKIYRRDSEVIYPPVDAESFKWDEPPEKGGFYLMLGQLTTYKKPDLVIDAFRELDRKLVVIGDGEMQSSLKETASLNVTFLGRQSFTMVKKYLAEAEALLFPGIEDFGIVPLEAMASGTPVIAYRAGGALDTVVESKTGVFFDEQSVESLLDALKNFEETKEHFDSKTLREHALKFNNDIFESNIYKFIDSCMNRN